MWTTTYYLQVYIFWHPKVGCHLGAISIGMLAQLDMASTISSIELQSKPHITCKSIVNY